MVQIGFKPGLQMGVDTGIKSPMQSTQPALSNRVANIPKAPMMSYDVRGTILAGVSDDKAKKIVDIVSSKAKSEEERKAMLQDAHEQAVKLEQQAAFKKDREEMKQELIARIGKTSDPKEQGQLQTQVKLSTFADLIRDGAKKAGTPIEINDDQELITKHLEANQHLQPTFKDYIEGKKSTTDLLPDMGLGVKEETPVESKVDQNFTNVVGGAYDSATGLPRFLGTNLAKGAGWLAKELGADETKVQALVDSYIKSTDDFSGKAMGADEESIAYKGTKLVGDLAQIANPAGLGKLGIKAGQVAGKVAKESSLLSKVAQGATIGAVDTAVMMPQSEQRFATPGELIGGAVIGGAVPVIKPLVNKIKETKAIKKLLDINPLIQEKATASNIQKAGTQNRITQPSKDQSWLSKKVLGEKADIIAPTKNITRADKIIKTKIVGSDKMTAPDLLTAVNSEVKNMGYSLSPKLKKVPVSGTEAKKMWNVSHETKKILNDPLSVMSADQKKATAKLIKDMQTTKTVDDVWKARQTFDDLTPNSVKNYNGIPPNDILESKQKIWKETRDKINEIIHSSTETIKDINTKEAFKDMSSLYEAKTNITKNLPSEVKATEGLLGKGGKLNTGKITSRVLKTIGGGAIGVGAYEMLK